jgi:hypothetical protein
MVTISQDLVRDMHIRHAKEPISGNRQTTVHDIASNSGTNTEVLKELSMNLLFMKVCAWWVPKIVMLNEKAQHVAVPAKHLHRFDLQGNTFPEHGVTRDKIWVHYFTPESKWSSIRWHHKGSPPLKNS